MLESKRGRPSLGKKRFTVWLTSEQVEACSRIGGSVQAGIAAAIGRQAGGLQPSELPAVGKPAAGRKRRPSAASGPASQPIAAVEPAACSQPSAARVVRKRCEHKDCTGGVYFGHICPTCQRPPAD